jgi:hypothetical protein
VSKYPRVLSPVSPLFTRDGIEVVLVSVEVWRDHLIVRLAALPNDHTEDLQRRYELELERWGQTRSGAHPEQPGTRLLAPLEVAVEDDAEAAYAPVSSSSGGSGSEWHGDWFFRGEVPESVRRLTVRVTPHYGEAAAVELDLAAV